MQVQTTSRVRLEALVESFDRDTANGREKIRDLLDRDPQAFQDGVVRVLRSSTSSRGIQYVVSLLVTSSLLFAVLCDLALTHEEAVKLARTAMQVDNLADINLAKRLAEDAVDLPSLGSGRLMEILDEVSNGNRIMPSLLRLLRQPNPQLRSKAVLMIGRSSRNVKWAQTRLGDADPRARANAVEALWGLGTIEAHAFLRAAVRDSNGRVAANALAGLYLLGDPWAIPELFKMGQSDSPMLRSSAAWAMGETGDRRFAEALGRMMCDASALVRKRVFSALGRIKSVAAQTRLGHQWRLATQVLPAVGGARRFSLEVALADGSALPQLLATQFLLTEAGQAVNAYQVEERLAPEVFSLSFILPRFERANAVEDSDAPVPPWVRGAMSCVAWKRRSDLWRVVFFREGKDPADPTPKTPNYTSMAETVAASLKEPPEQAACTDFWSVLREAVQPNTPIRGARQLIVYCPSDPGIPTDALEIISAAKAAGVVIQAIAGASNATLEDLCRRTHGKFRIALSTEDLRSIVEETYLTLLSRFDITYQPLTRGAASLHIRAANATGWGETTLAL